MIFISMLFWSIMLSRYIEMLIHSYTCELNGGPRSEFSNFVWRVVIAFFLVASATFIHNDIQKICNPDPKPPVVQTQVEKAK